MSRNVSCPSIYIPSTQVLGMLTWDKVGDIMVCHTLSKDTRYYQMSQVLQPTSQLDVVPWMGHTQNHSFDNTKRSKNHTTIQPLHRQTTRAYCSALNVATSTNKRPHGPPNSTLISQLPLNAAQVNITGTTITWNIWQAIWEAYSYNNLKQNIKEDNSWDCSTCLIINWTHAIRYANNSSIAAIGTTSSFRIYCRQTKHNIGMHQQQRLNASSAPFFLFAWSLRL